MAETSPNRRRSDLAMIHIAAKQLFGDVSKSGAGRDDYEDWLEKKTGKRSSGALTTGERIDLIKRLRKDGLIPDRPNRGRGSGGPGGVGVDRPTSAQWGRIGGLARGIGWEKGLEDGRLRAFVERTAKVSSAKFLNRTSASKVILGLEAMERQRGEGGDELS